MERIGDIAARVLDDARAAMMASGIETPDPRAVRLWTSEKIAAAGVYDMPIDIYHGDCCVGPSISSSGLRTIELRSPAHYWCTSYLNPDAKPRPASKAMDLGRAAHTLLLGEGGFHRKYAVRPEKWTDWRAAAAQEWRDWQEGAGYTVLTPDNLRQIVGMARALERHPLIRNGLLAGEIERSVIWPDAETGVWLKSRPDALPSDDATLVDLKTCASADPLSVRRASADMGYVMQMALGGIALREVCGIEIANDGYVLVFVETTPPYAVNVKPLDPEDLMYARGQIRRAIRTFADCLTRGDWPGYADDTITMSLPDWQRNRLKADFEAGLLPAE